MKYPRYYGKHFTDFKKLGDLVEVLQLRDMIRVRTWDHMLYYEGRVGGTLSNRGWELVEARDLDGVRVNVDDVVDEVDGDDYDIKMGRMEKENEINPLYEKLLPHFGHELDCVYYGDKEDPVNVAIECITCGEVLVDADKYDEYEEVTNGNT